MSNGAARVQVHRAGRSTLAWRATRTAVSPNRPARRRHRRSSMGEAGDGWSRFCPAVASPHPAARLHRCFLILSACWQPRNRGCLSFQAPFLCSPLAWRRATLLSAGTGPSYLLFMSAERLRVFQSPLDPFMLRRSQTWSASKPHLRPPLTTSFEPATRQDIGRLFTGTLQSRDGLFSTSPRRR